MGEAIGRLNAAEAERCVQVRQRGRRSMASLSPAVAASPLTSADRWTAYSFTVWAICMLGFAFDIYEGTIMQLVTPILIKGSSTSIRAMA